MYRYFNINNCIVYDTNNVPKAVELYKEYDIDLVVLDYYLLNGEVGIDFLDKVTINIKTIVIVLSADIDPYLREHEGKISSVFIKLFISFEIDELLETLK